MTGNDYSFEVSNGRLDAFNGLLLKGQKDGNFMPALISESGLFIPGDGKKLKLIKRNDGKDLIIAAQHNGPLRVFTSLN